MKKDIKCGVPQGSTLLLMLYGNDLPNSSNLLASLMFPDDTDFFFFCEHSNINTLFKAVNDKLNKINKWFSANKTVTKCSKYQIFIIPQIMQKYIP